MKKTLVTIGALLALSGVGVGAGIGTRWLAFQSAGYSSNPCPAGRPCVYPNTDGALHTVTSLGADSTIGSLGSLTCTAAATSPIASGQPGVWANSGDGQLYYQKADNTQTLISTPVSLNPAAQEFGSANLSGSVEADTSFIGPQWSTLMGLTQVQIDDTNGFHVYEYPNFTGGASNNYFLLDPTVGWFEVVTAGNQRNTIFTTYGGISAANSRVVDIIGGTANDLYLQVGSGVFNQYCKIAESAVVGTAVTAGTVVVWSGATKVETAAATANLTKIAGVAISTGSTGATVTVCKVGRVIVNADAGIVAGDVVVTSGAVGGNVATNNAASAGAKIGRAIEATSGTLAGQVLVDVEM